MSCAGRRWLGLYEGLGRWSVTSGGIEAMRFEEFWFTVRMLKSKLDLSTSLFSK
jgi:hypothetical protein